MDNVSIKMSKNKDTMITQSTGNNVPNMQTTPIQPIQIQKTETSSVSEEITEQSGNIVKSPIVGTFYAAPGSDKPSFVKIGDKVKEGDILCIVEAMKIMNEIPSPYTGEIAEIYVSNEELVEYGQSLFRIK